MSDVREQLAAALTAGLKAQNGFETRGGGLYMGSGGAVDPAALADALLSLPGIAIIALPPRSIIPSAWNKHCLGAWQGPAGEDPVSAWPTNRYDTDAVAMPGGDFITISDARALAAALLAAADAAEKAVAPDE